MAWPRPFKSLWTASEASRPWNGAACPCGSYPGCQLPAPWMASRMVISAHPKILLRLIHKERPGGPGARVYEKVLEVPARKGVKSGSCGQVAGSRASRGRQPLVVLELAPPGPRYLDRALGLVGCAHGHQRLWTTKQAAGSPHGWGTLPWGCDGSQHSVPWMASTAWPARRLRMR